jgi:hypothetical protein
MIASFHEYLDFFIHTGSDAGNTETWKNGENVGDPRTFLGRNSPLFSALTFIPL